MEYVNDIINLVSLSPKASRPKVLPTVLFSFILLVISLFHTIGSETG